MKPFESGSKQMKNFTDCHTDDGYINWWEERNLMKSKRAKREKHKKNLKREIDEIGD